MKVDDIKNVLDRQRHDGTTDRDFNVRCNDCNVVLYDIKKML